MCDSPGCAFGQNAHLNGSLLFSYNEFWGLAWWRGEGGSGATDPFIASHRIHAKAIVNISFNSGFLPPKNVPQAS